MQASGLGSCRADCSCTVSLRTLRTACRRSGWRGRRRPSSASRGQPQLQPSRNSCARLHSSVIRPVLWRASMQSRRLARLTIVSYGGIDSQSRRASRFASTIGTRLGTPWRSFATGIACARETARPRPGGAPCAASLGSDATQCRRSRCRAGAMRGSPHRRRRSTSPATSIAARRARC